MFKEYAQMSGGRPFGPREAQAIFKEMVTWELRNGRLSNYRRAKLVKFAAALRLGAVEAGETIQEATAEFEAKPESTAPKLIYHSSNAAARGTWWPTVAIFAGVVVLAIANLI